MPVVAFIQFQSPEWLLLAPALALVGWTWKRLKLWRPLRAAALALIVLILMGPQLRLKERGMDLWVLVDRSESAAEFVAQDLPEWKKLLEKSKPSGDDRIRFIEYAADVMELGAGGSETQVYAGNRKLTRTGLAVEHAAALLDPERLNRVLVFTDGYATEPLTAAAEKLAAAEVPLDFRLLRKSEESDARAAALRLPSRTQIGEPFLLEIEVAADVDGKVPVEIFRNGESLDKAEVEVAGGRGMLRFTDRIPVAGAHKYEVAITPAKDAFLGNNRFENWIEVTGGPRVLLATKYEGDPLAEVLRAQGFEVEVVTATTQLHPGQLAGARAAIFNNVPAYEVPGEFLKSLDFFVRDQGGGFLMAGGNQSFGAGGYYQSSVDELLPVTMELKTEHRKLAVAMAIVMDRSGSMSMTVPGGRTKMDLANEGAARAIELLGGMDQVAVFAVDSEAHRIVSLQNVEKNRNKLLSVVRRIESTGGGIFVYNGLEAAWKQLKTAEVGQRHIILFSDAADSEQPAKYKELIKEMRDENTTVSVIGLGTDRDPDADFLKDIAKRGEGRIFFSDRAAELPNIFAQETVAVARSAFIEEPVGAKPTGGWFELSAKAFDWLPQVDGYNLSYLRPNATAALLTTDEYEAPLVAFAQRGIGRSGAVSFALGAEHSELVRSWDRYGDFIQTLTRWLMGEDLPPGIGMRHRLEGTRLVIDLLYDEDEGWEERFAAAPPRLVLASGAEAATTREVTWRRMEPGRYQAAADLDEGELVRGAIQLGQNALPFGPVIVGTSTEWAMDRTRAEELRTAAAETGGRELLELSEAWEKPSIRIFAGVRSPLLIALLVLILAEALIARMGWELPTFAAIDRLKMGAEERRRDKAARASRKQEEAIAVSAAAAAAGSEKPQKAAPASASASAPASAQKPAPAPASAQTPPAEPPSEQEEARRKSRFQRAKRGL
ncbi:MAG: vWA domain-containing protein [Verrucomicrobiales bacterium]